MAYVVSYTHRAVASVEAATLVVFIALEKIFPLKGKINNTKLPKDATQQQRLTNIWQN